MSKKVKAIIRITLLVLVALILGLNVYSLNASRLAGDTVPMPFGLGLAVVLSGSMGPEMSEGDLLVVVKSDSYGLRDVVVYQDGNITVTHRIVAISEEGEITTRGDANNDDDAPITADRIKGKVLVAIPLVGYLVNIIKSPIGTIVILGLAVLLLERSFHNDKRKDADELKEIRKEIERLKEEQSKRS